MSDSIISILISKSIITPDLDGFSRCQCGLIYLIGSAVWMASEP